MASNLLAMASIEQKEFTQLISSSRGNTDEFLLLACDGVRKLRTSVEAERS